MSGDTLTRLTNHYLVWCFLLLLNSNSNKPLLQRTEQETSWFSTLQHNGWIVTLVFLWNIRVNHVWIFLLSTESFLTSCGDIALESHCTHWPAPCWIVDLQRPAVLCPPQRVVTHTVVEPEKTGSLLGCDTVTPTTLSSIFYIDSKCTFHTVRWIVLLWRIGDSAYSRYSVVLKWNAGQSDCVKEVINPIWHQTQTVAGRCSRYCSVGRFPAACVPLSEHLPHTLMENISRVVILLM